MAKFQTFNKRIGAWVKYEVKAGERAKILNVKQKEPKVPFEGIPKK